MVDELQDTNAVQLELIESIARENLFTVGDAQQSIYGFRHADVELFERRGERLEAIGRRADAADQLPLAAPRSWRRSTWRSPAELGERFRRCRPGRAVTNRRRGRGRPPGRAADRGQGGRLELGRTRRALAPGRGAGAGRARRAS